MKKKQSFWHIFVHKLLPVPCERTTELIVPILKADGLTCSLVPEDDSLGYKDLTNLASADFNYFYKMDT